MSRSFASPARQPAAATRGPDLRETWDGTCVELGYSSDIKAAGWDLLQRMGSTTDNLGGQGTQARSMPVLPAAPPDR